MTINLTDSANRLTDEQVVTLQLRIMSALSFYRQRPEKEARRMAELLELAGAAASELQERRKADQPTDDERIMAIEGIAPPAPQSSKMSGIMPDYEGVAMTQRECYMAGKEAGLAEARKSPVTPDCWIPVSERMPPEGEALLVCSGGGVVQRTVYGFDGENWLDWYEQYEPVKAEQDDLWQPLPAAPKEVKSER